MQLTDKVQRAIIRVSQLHKGMTRKSDVNIPFVVHPFSVAVIVSKYTNEENIISAALLHDVLEDVKGYSYNNLCNEFGDKVANIVKGVSEDKDPNFPTNKRATWKDRKLKYISVLKKVEKEALFVCAADKIHNISSDISCYKKEGDKYWGKFNASKGDKIWFYSEVLTILEDRLDSPIVKDYSELVGKLTVLVG